MKSRLTMGLAVALALFSGVPDQARAQCQLCVSCLFISIPTGCASNLWYDLVISILSRLWQLGHLKCWFAASPMRIHG